MEPSTEQKQYMQEQARIQMEQRMGGGSGQEQDIASAAGHDVGSSGHGIGSEGHGVGSTGHDVGGSMRHQEASKSPEPQLGTQRRSGSEAQVQDRRQSDEWGEYLSLSLSLYLPPLSLYLPSRLFTPPHPTLHQPRTPFLPLTCTDFEPPHTHQTPPKSPQAASRSARAPSTPPPARATATSTGTSTRSTLQRSPA